MQLKKFITKNYRSISEANIENIGKYCVFVGPNNAGKSNLLRALMIALSLATEGTFPKGIRRRRTNSYAYVYMGQGYDWDRDIPCSIKEKKDSHTVFKLTFEFSQEEKNEFSEKIGINLSKSLQMMFKLYENKTEYNIIMPGKAKKPMEKKIPEIGMFIRSKLDYQYIPCVRTSDFTSDYFARLVSKELHLLESNSEYLACIKKIKELQQPIISRLEGKLTSAMQTFLPKVNSVTIDSNSLLSDKYLNIDRYKLRKIPINIDDGSLTSLDDKGDGVKSLAAISLIHSLSLENATNKTLILCIEEPESHLHPDAIHSLRNVILDLTRNSKIQVVISTHSPLLIDRDEPKQNVQIDDTHRVKACKSISEIRDLLGIRITDNLDGLQRVVLVEGECDKKIISKLCAQKSQELNQQIAKGLLEFVAVGSASKMDFQIRLYNSLLIPTIIVLDSDQCGMQAKKSLVDSKLKNANEILLIKCKGMNSSEIEDLVDMKAYSDILNSRFNINIDNPKFKKRINPWSDRIIEAAKESPVDYNDELEKSLKIFMTDLVIEKGLEVIPEYNMGSVNNLVECIARFSKM